MFDRLTLKDTGPKTWAEHDLRRLISTAVAHTSRDLVKRSLGDRDGNGSARGRV